MKAWKIYLIVVAVITIWGLVFTEPRIAGQLFAAALVVGAAFLGVYYLARPRVIKKQSDS